MHHKFTIIDDEVLCTGSFNYSRAAVLWNYECVEVLRGARYFALDMQAAFCTSPGMFKKRRYPGLFKPNGQRA